MMLTAAALYRQRDAIGARVAPKPEPRREMHECVVCGTLSPESEGCTFCYERELAAEFRAEED